MEVSSSREGSKGKGRIFELKVEGESLEYKDQGKLIERYVMEQQDIQDSKNTKI